MKVIHLCLVLHLFQIHVYSQVSPSQQFIDDPNNVEKLSKGGVYYIANNQQNLSTEGTPFLFESQEAEIVTSRSKVFKSQKVSYDASRDEFIFEKGHRMLVLEKKAVDRIHFENRNFMVFDNEYYEILSEGEYTFLKKHTKTIRAGVYNAALNTGSKNGRWVLKTSYYILHDNQLSASFNLRKKTLMNMLKLTESERNEIETRALNYSSEKAVIDIFDLINKKS